MQLACRYALMAVLLTFSVIVLVTTSVYGVEFNGPDSEIEILEYTPDGPFATVGRSIQGPTSDIDIDSRIEFKFNRERLSRLLTSPASPVSPDIAPLRERIRVLQQAASSIETVLLLRDTAISLIAAARSADSSQLLEMNAAAQSAIQKSWVAIDDLINALVAAFQERLIEDGVQLEAAEFLGQDLEGTLLLPGGYAWDQIGQSLSAEIVRLEQRLATRNPEPLLSILATAHYIDRTGGKFPLYLPGYNEERECEVSPFEKIKFAASTEEEGLYQEYQLLATRMNQAKNLADRAATLGSAIYPAFATYLAEMQQLRSSVGPALVVMSGFRDTHTRKAWFDAIKAEQVATPEGQELWHAISELAAHYELVQEDIARIDTLAHLRDLLVGQNALQAMHSILRELGDVHSGNSRLPIWRLFDPAQFQLLHDKLSALQSALYAFQRKFPDAITSSNTKPILAFQKIAFEVERFLASTKDIAGSAAEFIERVTTNGNIVLQIHGLPKATGGHARTFAEDVDTYFDLRTMCHQREENAGVLVTVKFLESGDRVVATREYRFRVCIEGWQSDVYSSLAVVNRQNRERWLFNAPLTFVVKHSKWAGKRTDVFSFLTDNGLVSGVGFSTLQLNFDEEESIELGLGPTVSLLNDRILIGLGWNLMSPVDRRYFFLSFRVLDLSRQFGLDSGSNK